MDINPFSKLRTAALAAGLVCLLAGLLVLRYLPAASRQPPASEDSVRRQNAEGAPATSPAPPALVLCAIEDCPDRKEPASRPVEDMDRGGGAGSCPSGGCPTSRPPDGTVHCLALGCPTDDPDTPVSNNDQTPPAPPDRPPADGGGAGSINSFDECVRAGYPVAESYPEQCISPHGSFTKP